MLLTVLKSKLHRVKVTDANINYIGSITIDGNWMDAAGIIDGEQVHDLSPITLVLVPGRAFDAQGNRMGRGRGFYDRLLPQLPHALKAGVCFDCQKLPSVPVDENDIKMDFVI